MKKFVYVLFACVAFSFITSSAIAQEGVEGTTVRPMQIKAKVEGCKIAKPGDYEVVISDLIELNYTYPVVPAAIPKKVDYLSGLVGRVVKSPLGFRTVTTPKLVGTVTIAFYFEAKMAGEDTITLIIDEAEYSYRFRAYPNNPMARCVMRARAKWSMAR